MCEEEWQRRSPLRAGCPSTILLSPQEALDGRAHRLWGWCFLGLWEGGWETVCLHPPGSGAGCCNITCSFGPKWGTELTANNVQLLNVFCQKERKIKPCCKEPLQTRCHWHPHPVLAGPWGLWVMSWTPAKGPRGREGDSTACAGTAIPWDGVFCNPRQGRGLWRRGAERISEISWVSCGSDLAASRHRDRGLQESGGARARSLRSC